MENIEIGEYIRTKHHGIKKVVRINEKATKNKYVVYYHIDKEGDKTYITINIDDIINHSKNLIDLIEVGDYVNTNRVYNKNTLFVWVEGIDEYSYNIYSKDNIYSILTHEQYEQNCFIMEE